MSTTIEDNIQSTLQKLYRERFEMDAEIIRELPGSGSYRRYFRMQAGNRSVIGAYNEDVKENIAFLTYARQFRKHKLPVPEIMIVDPGRQYYLQEDLGDATLFSVLTEEKEKSPFTSRARELTLKALEWLPRFQIGAAADMDFSVAYPRAAFDRQSMLWDLSYFKYYFLKLARIPFDEQDLENDFNSLCDFLLSADREFFLYRDFQTRNIMIRDGEPWFIDFQGGRQGALQYDVASLLYDSKADIPPQEREVLLQRYLDVLRDAFMIREDTFMRYWHGYVLVRILQAMGAYGFRGFYEKKTHFLDSIPFALGNLDRLLDNLDIPVKLPVLTSVLSNMVRSERLHALGTRKTTLRIAVNSFSFKRGIPVDETGNGGGFVFDCRALPNPGRIETFRELDGRDPEVRDYLSKEVEVKKFLDKSEDMIRQSVQKYQTRHFSNLMINFGCTGGQHRSVYCAEEMAGRLREYTDVEVILRHRERELLS